MQRNNMMHNNPTRKKLSGFTLIEILVAITIFTLLSFSAYQVLNQTQRANQQSIVFSERLKEVQRAVVMIDNDFRQIALRRFRTDGEEASEKIFWWSEGLLDSDGFGAIFVRSGWQNPQQHFPRGEITKVGYRIRDEVLERVWWRYPDTPAGQEGIVTPLLSGVKALDMRFYDESGWTTSWDESNALPKAVELKLTLNDYGEILRVYLTSGTSLNVGTTSEGDSDG